MDAVSKVNRVKIFADARGLDIDGIDHAFEFVLDLIYDLRSAGGALGQKADEHIQYLERLRDETLGRYDREVWGCGPGEEV